jgi:Domain of Unknown Function with PDB structure (DUF3857)
MKQYLTIALLLISGILSGQGTKYENYNWNTIPEVPQKDTVNPVNGVKFTFERRIKELYLNKDSFFEEINVFHRRIRVETNNAIDNYNKIYVPVSNVIDILNIKARFISSAGKITELSQENIKEVKNLENKGDYKIFAIEGIEIGGEIEYFYTLRTRFSAFQSIRMQGEEPRMNIEVIFTFPSKLDYLIKSYNGFPDFTTEKDDKTGMTVMQAKTDYIPALAEEKYTNYRANLMRYEYSMAYNSYNSSLRSYSWSKVSSNMYNNFFRLSKIEQTAINDLSEKLEIKNGRSDQKIRAVENWIKTEISISGSITKNPSLDESIKYKQTSKFGATQLFIALFTHLNIPFELVLTCDRTERKFDPDFNGWNYLDNYLIYFPETDQYIVPDDPNIRLGVNAFNYQGEYGLFLHPIMYDEKLGSMAYQIKKLPVLPCSNSIDSFLIKVTCDFNQLKTDMVIHREMSGALGYSFQSFWESIDEERHKEMISEVFDMGDKNTLIRSYKVLNGSRIDIGVRPIIFDLNLTSNSLVESAGNDFIINIGKIIGTQSEMYQASNRKLPVDIEFLHAFYRKIEFNVPKGYKVSNLEEINIKAGMIVNGKAGAYFRSWYEQTGNTIYIYSGEAYPELEYPVSSFNEFRDVINASADFNKKKLIIIPL